MVQYDPDAWKTFFHERLASAMGTRGALTLFGQQLPGRASPHELIAEHFAAEQAEPVTIRGATFDKWLILPHRPDNHWWDCAVGSAVAASVEGMVWSAASAAGAPEPAEKPTKPISLKAMREQKMAAAGRR
jgi:hypothetical protein